MGNRNSGRRPKPTALKLLLGNPGKRPLNPHEPTITAASAAFDVPPPELLGDAVAITEWARVVPMLRQCGIASEAERGALVALCQQWSRYLEAQTKVRSLGMVIESKRGPIVNPYLIVTDQALDHCRKLWTELGLTPSARVRLTKIPSAAPATAPASKWASL